MLSHVECANQSQLRMDDSGGDAAAPRNRTLEVATSGFASVSRLPFGTTAGPASRLREVEPEQVLIVAEFEACPFCR